MLAAGSFALKHSKSALFKGASTKGLYRPEFEHDGCGVGFVADIYGRKSHFVMQSAINCLCNLAHRGGLDADSESGDGAGILTQIPYKLFNRELRSMGKSVPPEGRLGVGVFFMPYENTAQQNMIRNVTENIVKSHGLQFLGWRGVPIEEDVLGSKAALIMPQIEHAMISCRDDQNLETYEQLLFQVRNAIEVSLMKENIPNYIPSFSSKTIVYKGMLHAMQLQRFYSDLQHPLFETSIGVYHQRYSTNTLPQWALAHPFRMLAHNGEINTVIGNRAWANARDGELSSSFWGTSIEQFKPIVKPNGSDSANLDNMIEMISKSGRGLAATISLLVPPSLKISKYDDPKVKSFYEFQEILSEPWDGPAALVMSDGKSVIGCLDRNGLRPIRYKITKAGLLYLGSEMGIGAIPAGEVMEKGKIGPGQMIMIDTDKQKVFHDFEVKKMLAERKPYENWMSNQVTLTGTKKDKKRHVVDLVEKSTRFGFTEEDFHFLKRIFDNGLEVTGSMGDDSQLAVLSERPRLLFDYFKQLFAQVTNPPIDSIRESLVMDTNVFLGAKPSLLEEGPSHAKQIKLTSPLLTNDDLYEIKTMPDSAFQSVVLSSVFPVDKGVAGFTEKLENLLKSASEAVDNGKSIIIISDREESKKLCHIPMLLAIAGVHHHLIQEGKRMKVSIIAESGEVWNVHQFGCLIGYGASAINPYSVWDWVDNLKGGAKMVSNFQKATEKGLLKLMSKMGISKLSGYFGSQLFEVIGLHETVIDKYFTGTYSPISGIRIEDIAAETIKMHKTHANEKLQNCGYYAYTRGGDPHSVTPEVIKSLHKFVGLRKSDITYSSAAYQEYVKNLSKNKPITIRDMLTFKGYQPIPINKVESIETIRRRFSTAAMSHGAIAQEAHQTIAIAMNRMGCKSNSGEGGEDPARFQPLKNGDLMNSRIKQVASGRFGVTPEYLQSASEIEIKMCQGAKPGEGGQLPGHKVSEEIARLRYSPVGVVLISPPPHHDIYSIEDLAQLIYNMKHANPRAKVCVKLASEAGVGTIAAGVVKAQADVITIAGHSGGTGAAPLLSIRHAGSPWELGISETQQVLSMNDLRNRVTLRVDGGLRTGRDVVIAGILGAEEFSFGTAALMALGCVFDRHCHLGDCPAGIATQNPKLREKFKGSVEGLIAYFNAIAQEVREILSMLGISKFDDIIGHTEYLEQINYPNHSKANKINLAPVLYVANPDSQEPRYHTQERNDRFEANPFGKKLTRDVESVLKTKTPIKKRYSINNNYRSIGVNLSGAIAKRYGNAGLPPGTIELSFTGCAGQAFGAFLVNGVKLILTGEANDYVGEGMNGGTIVIKPSEKSTFYPSNANICGNVCLYGATGGELFVYGQGGERYGVRNSGAISVVEGVGDHGCEYMTGGIICVLGSVGKNFAAGMSGGVAYVLDEDKKFEEDYNKEMVEAKRLPEKGNEELITLIRKHLELTGSKKAQAILEKWEDFRPFFYKITPISK